jgi:hypothetical protein
MALPLVAVALGLSQFVPTIARLLNGDDKQKSDSLANKVVDLAKKITEVDDPVQSINLLHNNVKLVLEFQKEFQKIESELDTSFLQDKSKARDRDIAIAQFGRKNTRADIMVFAAALGLVMCLVSLAYYAKNLSGEAVGIISTVAGIFGSCLKDAYAFEFGSSRGSKEKDVTVAGLLQKYQIE